MQIRITFVSQNNIVLPIHYNSLVQAFIYNNIDTELATFLHDEGYNVGGRSFKLFTFSRIIGKCKNENRNLNFGKRIELIVASPLEFFCKSIANSMLQSTNLYLGQNNLSAEQIQINNEEVKEDKIMVITMSPITVYSTLMKPENKKYTCYFMPRESDFNRLITENLIKKFIAFNNPSITTGNIEVLPLGPVKQNITYFKNIIVKGASGKFLIKGNKELLQLGLDTGFGSKNSQGFGCVKIV